MKKHLFSLLVLSGMSLKVFASTDLMQVYAEALTNDPIYQQAISTQLATKEGVPISLAGLLPSALLQVIPAVNKVYSSGNTLNPSQDTFKTYQVALTLNQTIVDFGKFANLSGARALSRQADANLNAATQSLMLRVAQAYFNVLKDIDNLSYNKANKDAFAKQLDQINQQYKVGLKTITDVYTAQASYDTASAGYIAAQTTLSDDKENLRAITGNVYPSIATLSENFPLISPSPADMESWVRTATIQNWSNKSAEYGAQNAMAIVRQQFAGNLPTLNTQGSYTINYSKNSAGSIISPAGSSKTRDLGVALTLNVPIFEGGLVVASTEQARYNYQTALQFLEQTVRATANTTRQSYLGIIAGIQQIRADKQAVKSTISSYQGLEEGYRVGTQTLVDVLNQQQKAFQAETNYATDRYNYVINLLTLKQAAGTLSQEDLIAINAWLHDRPGDELVEIENQKPLYKGMAYPVAHAKSHHKKVAAKHLPKKSLA